MREPVSARLQQIYFLKHRVGSKRFSHDSGSATLNLSDTILKAGASGANIGNDGGGVGGNGYNFSSDNPDAWFQFLPGDQWNNTAGSSIPPRCQSLSRSRKLTDRSTVDSRSLRRS